MQKGNPKTTATTKRGYIREAVKPITLTILSICEYSYFTMAKTNANTAHK